MAKTQKLSVWVGIVGFLVASIIAVRVLAIADWDPTIFVAFGEEATPTTEYAEERLGDVFLRVYQGHDGKFFFVQANDPWVLDPDENAEILDRPLYRSQRMLYPALAGGGGLLGAEGVVWGLLVVNVLAMGVGTWAVARLASEMGGSAWWGLSFTLNLGFISELTIDGAGVLSAAFAFLALLMVLRARMIPGYIFLSLAVLSREAMLIAAAGAAFWLWRQKKRKEAILVAFVPGVSVAAWALYLRLRIGLEAGVDQVQELGYPFVGFVRAFENWTTDPMDLAVGVVMMALMLLYVRRTLISDHLVGWAFIGFVPLGILFTEQVWKSWFDISRAIAPVITAYVLLVVISTRTETRSDLKRTSVR